MMNKSTDKKILSALGFLSLMFVALVGYLYVNRQARKELPKPGQVSQPPAVKPQASPAGKPYPQLRPKTAMFLNYPKAEQKSILSFVADKNVLRVGESFNLQVKLNAQGEIVDGVEFILSFNPKLVEVAGEIGQGPFFSKYPQKELNRQEGKIRIIALQGPDESKALNEEVVVTIPFRALNKGKASFMFNNAETHVAAYAGQELLRQASPLTISIQ